MGTGIGSGGTIVASLCCLGTPVLLGFLSSIGLGFLINDFILFPLLVIFLGISIYASHKNKKLHHNKYPFILTVIGSVILIPAIFINTYLAYLVIIVLVVTSVWDIISKRKE